jgi:hypothetical protein
MTFSRTSLGNSDLENEANLEGHFTVATPCSTYTAFYRSDTGILGSIPTRNINVGMLSCVVLCRKRPCNEWLDPPSKSLTVGVYT